MLLMQCLALYVHHKLFFVNRHDNSCICLFACLFEINFIHFKLLKSVCIIGSNLLQKRQVNVILYVIQLKKYLHIERSHFKQVVRMPPGFFTNSLLNLIKEQVEGGYMAGWKLLLYISYSKDRVNPTF